MKLSRCCNKEIYWSKGSYMGSHDSSCTRCGMYCTYYEVEDKPVPYKEKKMIITEERDFELECTCHLVAPCGYCFKTYRE